MWALDAHCVEILMQRMQGQCMISVDAETLPLDWEQCVEYIQGANRTFVCGEGMSHRAMGRSVHGPCHQVIRLRGK